MQNEANKTLIKDLMKHKKYRGNVKDYVVLAGTMLMDHKGTYNVTRLDLGVEGQDETLLIHKKWLHRFIGDEEACRFWNRKLRMRVTHHVEKLSARS